ncbi:MAG TPA: hypothetical protein VJV78_09185 [Polyangiales bacterium]|nr:hypothetical protein [Polyangiales bacterium]
MEPLAVRLPLLLAFALLGLACKTATDKVLVPDQAAGAQGVTGAAGVPAPPPTPSDSSTMAGAPEQPVDSTPMQPSAAGMTGSTGGREAQPPAAMPTAGSTGSGGEKAPAASAGMAGSIETGSSAGGMMPSQPMGATEADCDFTGVWIAKQLTVSEALGLPQTSNSWLYLELQQTGHDVVVTKSLECGVEVRGTATVTLSRATLESALLTNSQVGRKATLKKVDGKCAFETKRFWKVRGADEQRFLPNGGRDSMDEIPKAAMDKPLPTATKTDGAVDTEGDGKLGMAFQVSGIITGVRNSVQREWSTWFTKPGFEIQPSNDWPNELTIAADFDNEEAILSPSSGLLAASGQPARGAPHQLKLRFLGRDRSDPRAAAIMKANDIDTCFAIQDAMTAETIE